MSIQEPAADPFVVLHGIAWEQYEKILDALGENHLRHTYDRGTLEMRGLVYGVEWKSYMAFLDALGDFSLRHSFDRGTLEMMSPRRDHDWVKRLIGRFIESMALDLDIPIQSVGSMTLSAEAAERGLQPDESYYVQNEPRVRGQSTYDPNIDLPPDLSVEVDVTHSSVPRLPLFAAIGIPEVWRHSGGDLRFFRLVKKGKHKGEYQETKHSLAYPFLQADDVNEILNQREGMGENALVRLFLERARDRFQSNPSGRKR